ncbi:MAG: [protein-PII] uridylyltransferase, partial [Gallionellaceae bacterium]|nr:[protein-PII] uridylyltransferase [Gallionellaceae bacterium]
MTLSANITEIRDSLRAARAALREDFTLHPHPRRQLRTHARLVDEHLRMAWQRLAMPSGLALVATGGYGRGELYPHSDIDVMILLPHPPDEAAQQRLQRLVGAMWDIGLEAGHSIRTVDDCVTESADITVQTTLLEARLITGSRALFRDMRDALSRHLSRRDFYLAKAQEQEDRHARFVDANFNLEPNLKESPGGLRDLQTVLWISRACGLGESWKKLAQAGLLTGQEAAAIARHENLLQTLRIRLHYLAGRREDRLLFDYQTALANEMRIAATASRRASEYLMQRYYRARHAVLLLNAVLLQNFHARLFPEDTEAQPLNARFVVRENRLEARDRDLFERQPSAMLESFLLMEQHPGLAGFSAPTLRALWRAQHRIDAAFRRDPRNNALFMDILRQPQGLTHALRRMNQTGVLGRYIPAFGRICGQMQHDLFHVYTVDEHILMVVRNLRRFTLEEHAPDHPLSNKLMRDFARPEVLYIAGLFHDIAKGRGGDHAALGKTDAARFCKQHGLTPEDSALAAWLVEHHLTLSRTAQSQDLSDPDVIAAFAAQIPGDRHLVALYLLTVADIRGTSPKIWNGWKAQLLETLFHAARRYMAGGANADQAGEIRAQASQLLGQDAIAPAVCEPLWAQLDTQYFLQHEPDEIVWHARLLADCVNSAEPVVRARLARIAEGFQVMVYTRDQPYLFARICGFFARMRYNIMQARIHTTRHGYALDSFLIMPASNDEVAPDNVICYIEHRLTHELARADQPAPPQSGRASRQLRHFPIAPEITLEDRGQHRYQLAIVTGDRPGLLARIAHVLARHRIEVHDA